MESHCTAHGLEIETVSARCAGVKELHFVKGKKHIPVCIVSHNAAVFGHTGTIRMSRICRRPCLINIVAVEILAVDGDSALFYYGGHSVAQPTKSLFVSEIQLERVSFNAVCDLTARLAVTDKPLGLYTVLGLGVLLYCFVVMEILSGSNHSSVLTSSLFA